MHIRLGLSHGFSEIGFGNDVVAVEDSPRLVAADIHGDTLVNTGSDCVPYSCATQVVEHPAGYFCLLTGRVPCFAKVSNRFSHAMEYKMGNGHHLIGFLERA